MCGPCGLTQLRRALYVVYMYHTNAEQTGYMYMHIVHVAITRRVSRLARFELHLNSYMNTYVSCELIIYRPRYKIVSSADNLIVAALCRRSWRMHGMRPWDAAPGHMWCRRRPAKFKFPYFYTETERHYQFAYSCSHACIMHHCMRAT